jgi:hypothetical protein
MVIITLGKGAELRVDDLGVLYCTRNVKDGTTESVPLGRATKQRMTDLQIHLQRLKTFAVDHEIPV